MLTVVVAFTSVAAAVRIQKTGMRTIQLSEVYAIRYRPRTILKVATSRPPNYLNGLLNLRIDRSSLLRKGAAKGTDTPSKQEPKDQKSKKP